MRDALLEVAGTPREDIGWDPRQANIIFGIVSSDIRLAVRALRDYTDVFGVPFEVPEVRGSVRAKPDKKSTDISVVIHPRKRLWPQSRVPGASVTQIKGGVYVKYIVASKTCYASAYNGKDRGVLVQLGQEQVGHFPLGLFDEEMSKAPPTM